MIPVLCTQPNSNYLKIEGFDCYDEIRDMRTFTGSAALIAHPPCRMWSKLKGLAKGTEDEKNLARICVRLVRQNGGVLEHPAGSSLWIDQNLPKGKCIDEFGGFTLKINQHWFGHPAEKKTYLYIVGLKPSEIPPYPLNFNAVTHSLGSWKANAKRKNKKEISKKGRSATPPALIAWLKSLIQKIEEHKSAGQCRSFRGDP